MHYAELRGIHEVRAKGRVYYYAWRGGPRIKAAYGTVEFVLAYFQAHAARDGVPIPAPALSPYEAWKAEQGLPD